MSSARSRRGGKPDRNDVQSIVQIFSKLSLFDRLFEVAIGRGDDPRVHRDDFGAAQAPEFLGLQHAEEIDL